MAEEQQIITTIRNVMPAVVSIVISKHLEDVEKDMAHPHEMYPMVPKKRPVKSLQDITHGNGSGLETDKDGMVTIGGSSGFFVDEDGLILTNRHVIVDAQAQHTVITNDGHKYEARVITRDPINDVAILKIDAKHMPFLELGDVGQLELGQSVIAIGNALGIFKNTVSVGIVSGLSRSITAQEDQDAPIQEMRGLIQTDAAINPGNSGGPLVDVTGRVIGINAAIVYGAQNIGFAIPVNAAARDLSDLKAYGHIRRPYLGVRYIIIDENLQSKINAPVDYGALVIREGPHDHAVMPGSPADQAGIKEKDIVLEVNGERVDRDHPIQDFLETLAVGDTLQLLVLRDAEKLNMKVVLAERM